LAGVVLEDADSSVTKAFPGFPNRTPNWIKDPIVPHLGTINRKVDHGDQACPYTTRPASLVAYAQGWSPWSTSQVG
jgi:hypothetical protein